MSIIEKYRTKPREAPAPTPKRVRRSVDWFVKLHDPQLEKLLGLDAVCCPLFLILAREGFRHRGKPFCLPTKGLITIKGLRRSNLYRALGQLERCGLIAVQRNPPRPPVITVRAI